MVKNILLGVLRSPLTLLSWTSERYFQPGVPWIAFLVLTVWCAIEATIFTFTLQRRSMKCSAVSPGSIRTHA